MEDLVFVPCKNVPAYRKRGYGMVPGNSSPRGWAVLMQKGLVENAPIPEPRRDYSKSHALPARIGNRIRSNRGSKRAKLTKEDVLKIRASKGVHSYAKLSAVYDISIKCVQNVMRGKSWAWL